MHITSKIVPAALAGSLLLGGASSVFAAKNHVPHMKRATVAGQVSNLAPTGFSLTFTPKKGKNGAAPVARTVQVTTTSSTIEKARKGTTGTLTNGEYAVVLGSGAKGAVTATRVLFSTKQFHIRRHALKGAVAAGTSASSLVVTTHAGKSRTFAITTTTRFFQGKTATTAPLALSAGQKVSVRFARDTAVKGQLDATVIRVKAAK
jgi:hypothetical protein